MTSVVPVTVVVLTRDEEDNLPRCLESVRGWTRTTFVVDSGSTDGTIEIALRLGAKTVNHPFESHSAQWAWALEALPIETEWVLGLDADQSVTPELRDEIVGLFAEGDVPDSTSGFFVKRRQIFRGRWIRHGGYYPKYLLKLFRRGRVFFDRRDLVDHHFYVQGPVRKLSHDLVEANVKEDDLTFWLQKHVRYAPRVAREEFLRRGDESEWSIPARLWGNPDERVVWLKRRWYRLPLFLRPFLYFSYRYFIRLGFLDGKQGFVFHTFQSFWYRLMVDLHLEHARTHHRRP